MKTRPWPLVVLAIIQVLTPIFNVLFNAWVLGVSPSVVLTWMFQRPWLEIFQTLALMPIAGYAVFRMKKWSYPVFFGAIFWSMLANLQHWQYVTSQMPSWAFLFVYGCDILLVSYFLLPAVRATYFDPRVRWWESKPRYELKLEVRAELSQNEVLEGLILNVSEGGAFVHFDRKLAVGDIVNLRFEIIHQEFMIPGKVVYARAESGQDPFYGVQFIHSKATVRRFQNLVRGLKALGFQDRSSLKPWFRDLQDWLVQLFKTGRGWIPELQYRKKG
ncbi:MAG: hypothetical protein A2603_04655 [Bdellovibrionales bacterium RIFOXYD1_FULL_55_31]|nr:MAG: hypothetical protein A2603_04655 [Bdellovibrionales bacterium RIFOXYD1_FULL_55_31]